MSTVTHPSPRISSDERRGIAARQAGAAGKIPPRPATGLSRLELRRIVREMVG